MIIIFVVIALIITYGSYLVWSFANEHLFCFLGEVEIENEIQECYMWDALTWPSRVFLLLLGTAAIYAVIYSWMWIFCVAVPFMV